MSSFTETRIDVLEFRDKLRFDGLPLAIDDMSLAFHLGIHNRTLWWLMHSRESLMSYRFAWRSCRPRAVISGPAATNGTRKTSSYRSSPCPQCPCSWNPSPWDLTWGLMFREDPAWTPPGSTSVAESSLVWTSRISFHQ